MNLEWEVQRTYSNLQCGKVNSKVICKRSSWSSPGIHCEFSDGRNHSNLHTVCICWLIYDIDTQQMLNKGTKGSHLFTKHLLSTYMGQTIHWVLEIQSSEEAHLFHWLYCFQSCFMTDVSHRPQLSAAWRTLLKPVCFCACFITCCLITHC